jgi:hypothetical protein
MPRGPGSPPRAALARGGAAERQESGVSARKIAESRKGRPKLTRISVVPTGLGPVGHAYPGFRSHRTLAASGAILCRPSPPHRAQMRCSAGTPDSGLIHRYTCAADLHNHPACMSIRHSIALPEFLHFIGGFTCNSPKLCRNFLPGIFGVPEARQRVALDGCRVGRG